MRSALSGMMSLHGLKSTISLAHHRQNLNSRQSCGHWNIFGKNFLNLMPCVCRFIPTPSVLPVLWAAEKDWNTEITSQIVPDNHYQMPRSTVRFLLYRINSAFRLYSFQVIPLPGHTPLFSGFFRMSIEMYGRLFPTGCTQLTIRILTPWIEPLSQTYYSAVFDDYLPF